MRRCALALALLSAGAFGEMTADEYRLDRSIETATQRERVRAQIERDLAAEQDQARHDAEQQALRRAEIAAEEQRRTPGERLLRERCTLCHAPDNYLAGRHTPWGWHAVILRMRWLNGARVGWGEQFTLVGELARTRPASGHDAWIEHALALTALAVACVPSLVLLLRLGRHPG